MKRIVGLLVSAAVLISAMPALSQDKADKPKLEKEKQAVDAEKKADTGEKDPSKLYVDLSALMYLEWAYFSGFKYTGSTTWGKVARWGVLTDAYYLSGDPADLVPVERYNYKKNENTFRMRTLDGGWVWGQDDNLSLSDLRYSAGIGISWISPLGPMKFSYAYPVNNKPGDKLQRFQFSIGTGF